MDCLNFFNAIYFIRDLLRSLLYSTKEEPSTAAEFSSLDDAIAYYSSDPRGLFNSIVSSDISLIEITVAQTSVKEYSLMIRNISKALERKINLTGYIDASKNTVYLRDFLISESDGDVVSDISVFYNSCRKLLTLYKELNPSDVNHRLASSLVANVIYIKEVFAGIQYSEHDI